MVNFYKKRHGTFRTLQKMLLLIVTIMLFGSNSVFAQMTLTFTTTYDGQEVYLPMNGAVDVTVVWDDATADGVYTTASNDYSHTYATAGTLM